MAETPENSSIYSGKTIITIELNPTLNYQGPYLEFYPAPADNWSEDPDWPRQDWHGDVVGGDTNLGYWAWVEHNKDSQRGSGDELDDPDRVTEPPDQPEAPKAYFIAETDDTDLDDDAEYYLMEDGSWSALDRSNVQTARHFGTIEDAIAAAKSNSPFDCSIILINSIDADGSMDRVAHIWPPTAEGRVAYYGTH